MARDLAKTLARKRPSPLVQGRAPTWACDITYALGMVNFLFDHAQTLHVSGSGLCALFGISQSAGSAKAREIMRLLRIVQLDPRWCLASKLADNPLVWMIEVNGFMVDVRMMARELQEEAHRLGLIPFVPDDVSVRASDMTTKTRARRPFIGEWRIIDMERPAVSAEGCMVLSRGYALNGL